MSLKKRKSKLTELFPEREALRIIPISTMKTQKETSRIAHVLIKPHIKNMHSRILTALEKIEKGTFRQIAVAADLEPDQVWKIMSELECKGFVEGNEMTICSKSNRPVTLWKLKDNLFKN